MNDNLERCVSSVGDQLRCFQGYEQDHALMSKGSKGGQQRLRDRRAVPGETARAA